MATDPRTPPGPHPETLSLPTPDDETGCGKKAAPLAPGACGRYMRERFAGALPALADRLLDTALDGDIPALRIILQIAELKDEPAPPPATPHRCKTLEELLMEDWRKEPVDD